jgi:hypothetical protein
MTCIQRGWRWVTRHLVFRFCWCNWECRRGRRHRGGCGTLAALCWGSLSASTTGLGCGDDRSVPVMAAGGFNVVVVGTRILALMVSEKGVVHSEDGGGGFSASCWRSGASNLNCNLMRVTYTLTLPNIGPASHITTNRHQFVSKF